MTASVRVIVVGGGLMGRWHAHAARRAGGRIVGVVDRNVARAGELAGRVGAAVAATLDEVARTAPADVVHICTPMHTHEDLVLRALESGAHVLCEKPLAADATVAGRLLAAARDTKRLLCPVHQYIFQPGARRARRRLPEVGAVLHADCTICSAGAEAGTEVQRDRLASEILPHPLSVFRALLPAGVLECGWTVSRARAGEWRVTGGASGVQLGVLLSMEGRPTRSTTRLICEAGTIHLDHYHGFAVVERGRVSRANKAWRPFALSLATLGSAGRNLAVRAMRREPAFPGLQELTARFYEAAMSGRSAPLSTEHCLDVARARDRILDEMSDGATTPRAT